MGRKHTHTHTHYFCRSFRSPYNTVMYKQLPIFSLRRGGGAGRGRTFLASDQILRRERGCSADHGQDWQPNPFDPYSALNDYYLYRVHIPRLPTHGHDRPCRRDVGRVFLAGVRPDSPLRRRIPSSYCPGPGRGAAVEMGQRSVHQAHTTPVNSVHVSAPRADMFGDSVCAREADGTAAESRYVPLYEGVHPVCRLDSATGWRSGCRRAGGLVEPFVREKIQDWNRSA